MNLTIHRLNRNRYILLGTIVLIVTVLLAPFIMQHDIKTDSCSIGDQYYLQELEDGEILQQTFVMPGNRLNGIEIILTDFDVTDSNFVFFELRDQEGEILDSVSVYLKDFENGQFQLIQFKKRPFLKKGATYSITISIDSDEKQISKVLLIPLKNGTELNQTLTVGDDIVDNYALAINYQYQEGPVSWFSFFIQLQIVAIILVVSVYVLKENYGKKQSNVLFLYLLTACQLSWGISVVVTKGQTLYSLIHPYDYDQFMDFFNSIQYGKTPYEKGVIYPPLANLIYAVLGHIIPSNRLISTVDVRNTQMGGVVFFLYTLVVMYFLVCFMQSIKYVFPKKVQNVMFDIGILMSTPFIFSYERGNIVLLCLVFCLGYYHFRSSGKIRTSFVSLSFAIGLKIYPAVYGLMELKKGKKRILYLVILSIAVFMLPFAFFSKGSIGLMINNIQKTSAEFQMNGVGSRHDLENMMSIIHYAFGIDISQVITLIVRYGFVLLGILVVLLDKKMNEWKQYCIASSIMILYPSFSYTYTLIFMLIPLMAFMKEKTFERLDYVYLVLFLFIFVPYIVSSRRDILEIPNAHYYLTYACLAETIALIALYILIIVDSLRRMILQHEHIDSNR